MLICFYYLYIHVYMISFSSVNNNLFKIVKTYIFNDMLMFKNCSICVNKYSFFIQGSFYIQMFEIHDLSMLTGFLQLLYMWLHGFWYLNMPKQPFCFVLNQSDHEDRCLYMLWCLIVFVLLYLA